MRVVVDMSPSDVLPAVTFRGVIPRPAPSGRFEPRRRAFPRDVAADSPEAAGGTSEDTGEGSYAMFPAGALPEVQRWAGWPVEWATPTWGSMVGIEEITRRVSTVFAAMDLNARVLSTMPPYRTRDGVVVEPLAWMRNPQPEVYTDWSEAFKQVVLAYYGREVFLWATSRFPGSGRVRTWVMVNPNRVTVELTGFIRRYAIDGRDETPDVLHIRYASWPGDAHGHGPLEAAARTLVGAEALERYQAGLAARGGIPWGVLSTEQRLTANQAGELSAQWVASRYVANGAPAVLGRGATLQPFQVSPKDMALLELRQFDEARLSVLLGVPPSLLGLPSGETSMTYNTTEKVYDFHWRAGLRPTAAALMGAITRWTLSDQREAIELNRDEYVRPGLQERVQAYQVLHNIVEVDPQTGLERRAISVEEIRSAERMISSASVPASATSLAVPA